MDYALHRVLQDWSETAATWVQRLPGQPWASSGGNGLGTDLAQLRRDGRLAADE